MAPTAGIPKFQIRINVKKDWVTDYKTATKIKYEATWHKLCRRDQTKMRLIPGVKESRSAVTVKPKMAKIQFKYGTLTYKWDKIRVHKRGKVVKVFWSEMTRPDKEEEEDEEKDMEDVSDTNDEDYVPDVGNDEESDETSEESESDEDDEEEDETVEPTTRSKTRDHEEEMKKILAPLQKSIIIKDKIIRNFQAMTADGVVKNLERKLKTAERDLAMCRKDLAKCQKNLAKQKETRDELKETALECWDLFTGKERRYEELEQKCTTLKRRVEADHYEKERLRARIRQLEKHLEREPYRNNAPPLPRRKVNRSLRFSDQDTVHVFDRDAPPARNPPPQAQRHEPPRRVVVPPRPRQGPQDLRPTSTTTTILFGIPLGGVYQFGSAEQASSSARAMPLLDL